MKELTINNVKLKIYEVDTLETILTNIASLLDTLPIYLKFEKPISSIEDLISLKDEQNNITVQDILFNIKNTGDDIRDLSQMIKQSNIQNIKDDVVIPLICFFNFQQGQKLDLEYKIMSYLDTAISVETIYENRQTYIDILNNKIVKNKNESLKYEKEYYLESIQGIPYTDFDIEKIQVMFKFSLENTSLMDVFDNVQLNQFVPFAKCREFYKILKDYVPPNDWIENIEDMFELKTLNNINFKVYDKQNDIFIDAIMSEEDSKIGLYFVHKNLKDNSSVDRLLANIISVIPILDNIPYTTETFTVNGKFFFPKFSFNKYIISDLIMNDDLFSKFYIDESKKTSKNKSGIHMYFQDGDDFVSFIMTVKKVNRFDIDMKDIKDRTKFRENSLYIRTKIVSARNEGNVHKFQIILSKMLSVYTEKKQEIISQYKRYIPTFDDGENIDIEEIEDEHEEKKPYVKSRRRSTNKNDDINIYKKGMNVRECGHAPITLKENEIREINDGKFNGYQVMKFPVHGEAEEMYYVCSNHEKHIFPGIKETDQNEIGFSPCCYLKNHIDHKFSKYNMYVAGDEKVKVLKQNELIKTKKTVAYNQFGKIPPNVESMFKLIDTTNISYIRKGVDKSESSFLNCVMEALNVLNIQSYKNDEVQRRRLVSGERSRLLSDLNILSSSMQELYDKNIGRMREVIRNISFYLDPYLFCHLLEVKYNCNIYVFKRVGNNDDAYLMIPHHKEYYYKRKNTNRTIFIYEHKGAELESDEMQCELIVSFNDQNAGKGNTEYEFRYNSKIVQGVSKIFNNMQSSYCDGDKLKPIQFPELNILSQMIDSYGKTRVINISYKDKNISILTSPLEPFNVPISNDITKIELKYALKFFKDMGVILSSQLVVNGNTKEIQGKYGSVSMSIPVVYSGVISDLPFSQTKVSIADIGNSSVLEEYNKNKKLAKYISEYFLWIYSLYLNENSFEPNEDNIQNFTEQKTIMLENFNYSISSKKFSLDEQGVFQNNKMVVVSEEMLKRLIYVLKLSILRYTDKVKNYYKKFFFENYYEDISDFIQYPFQNIIKGKDNFEYLVNDMKDRYDISDSVRLDMLSFPYFFRNKDIDTNIYLAQNTDTIEKAIYISKIWKERRINIGDDFNFEEGYQKVNYKYVLCEYRDFSYVQYLVSGVENDIGIKIIASRVGDDLVYTTLLLF